MASGPNSYDLLSASLAACTAMTIRLHARHKNYPLSHVEVAVSTTTRTTTAVAPFNASSRCGAAWTTTSVPNCCEAPTAARSGCAASARNADAGRAAGSRAAAHRPRTGSGAHQPSFRDHQYKADCYGGRTREHRWSSAGCWIVLGFGSLGLDTAGNVTVIPGILVTEVDVKHQAVRARNPRPSQEFRRRRGGLGLPARVTDQRFAHRPSSSTMNTIGLGCSIADGFVPRSGECGCSLMSIS